MVVFCSNISYNRSHRWERFFPTFEMTSCKLTSSSLFGHVDISAWSCCIFIPNFMQISSTVLLNSIGRVVRPPTKAYSWWLPHPCKFHQDRLISVQLISIWTLSLTLESTIHGPQFQFWGVWFPKFKKTSDSKRHILARIMTRFDPSSRLDAPYSSM